MAGSTTAPRDDGPLQYMMLEPAPSHRDRGRVWFFVLRHDPERGEVYLRTVIAHPVPGEPFILRDDQLPRSEWSLRKLHFDGSEVTVLEWLRDNSRTP
jgi:hypothetical protein